MEPGFQLSYTLNIVNYPPDFVTNQNSSQLGVYDSYTPLKLLVPHCLTAFNLLDLSLDAIWVLYLNF